MYFAKTITITITVLTHTGMHNSWLLIICIRSRNFETFPHSLPLYRKQERNRHFCCRRLSSNDRMKVLFLTLDITLV